MLRTIFDYLFQWRRGRRRIFRQALELRQQLGDRAFTIALKRSIDANNRSCRAEAEYWHCVSQEIASQIRRGEILKAMLGERDILSNSPCSEVAEAIVVQSHQDRTRL